MLTLKPCEMSQEADGVEVGLSDAKAFAELLAVIHL